jgi:hypothetical protein
MIVFVTTKGHGYTTLSLVQRHLSSNLPTIRVTDYDKLFRSEQFPTATYIFCDIERLYSWERHLAAQVFRALVASGLKCLNDPAMVMARYELLRALHRVGINPFTVYRADDDPRPSRFPVFLRDEDGHKLKSTPLLADQAALEHRLNKAKRSGKALRGMLVVEFCAAPIAPGKWCKLSTFRIGGNYHSDLRTIGDGWIVKGNAWNLLTAADLDAEKKSVERNEYPANLRAAFEHAAIDYGRADHCIVDGRHVVYEVNTNPTIMTWAKTGTARDESVAIAAERMAKLLRIIDSGEGGPVRLLSNLLDDYKRSGPSGPNRP